jgi:nucleoside-diphosphate-sugar epimerase
MRFHTAVNKFCWQAAMRSPITVWKTAYNQKRPYLDLKDCCRAIVHVIKNDLFNGEIYNVLTKNLTVHEVVENIKQFIPDLSIEFVSRKIMNQLSYEVSNKKFIKTGFNFTSDISKSLEEEISLIKIY